MRVEYCSDRAISTYYAGMKTSRPARFSVSLSLISTTTTVCLFTQGQRAGGGGGGGPRLRQFLTSVFVVGRSPPILIKAAVTSSLQYFYKISVRGGSEAFVPRNCRSLFDGFVVLPTWVDDVCSVSVVILLLLWSWAGGVHTTDTPTR